MKARLFFLTILISITGCDDFLKEEPPILSVEAKLSSNEIAVALVNSAYSDLDVLVTNSGEWGGNTIELIEYPTGKVDGQAQARDDEFNNLRYNAESNYIFDWWSKLYSGIKAANLAISEIETGFNSLSDASRSELLGEARALRAFYYFYLVRIFGDAPIIERIPETIDEMTTPRKSVNEIYQNIIIPDLLSAEKSGIQWSNKNGRVSMGLIKALLADVFLTYAGYPTQGGDQFYKESANRSLEVINSGAYSLFSEYSDMIKPENKNQGEFIFQVQFDEDNRNNPLTALALPTLRDVSPAYISEFGSLIPRTEFYNSFSKVDKRAKNDGFFIFKILDKELNGPHISKFFDEKAILSTARSSLNFTIYRLADVMLMYAEASNRAEGKPNTTATHQVNLIRKRAGLPSINYNDIENFEREVWTQRYFELCFEGKMWFDMVRTRKVRNDLTGEWENFVGHTNVFGAIYSEKHLLFPISQRELQINSELKQNQGY